MPLHVSADPGVVWRVGYRPDPWMWTDWRYAENGRFTGRWDDSRGEFRTVYAGESLVACLTELLAGFRRDAALSNELSSIDDDPVYPHRPAATLSFSWLDERIASRAHLSGWFCEVAAAVTIAELYPLFAAEAIVTGATDFDAAVLRDSGARHLTQGVASWIYDRIEPCVDGIAFRSRHGDELRLWALFERPDEGPRSPRIRSVSMRSLTPETAELVRTFELLGLKWEEP